MIDLSDDHDGPPVAVILHERLGRWARQLRPRLGGSPVRWFETRSADDLGAAIEGRASPVILIDLGKDPAGPLEDLLHVVARAPSARILVVDPEGREGVKELARGLGATHVLSGFAPPPEVAALIARWVNLAGIEIEGGGWSLPFPVDPARQPEEWIDGLVADAAKAPAPGPPVEEPADQC